MDSPGVVGLSCGTLVLSRDEAEHKIFGFKKQASSSKVKPPETYDGTHRMNG